MKKRGVEETSRVSELGYLQQWADHVLCHRLIEWSQFNEDTVNFCFPSSYTPPPLISRYLSDPNELDYICEVCPLLVWEHAPFKGPSTALLFNGKWNLGRHKKNNRHHPNISNLMKARCHQHFCPPWLYPSPLLLLLHNSIRWRQKGSIHMMSGQPKPIPNKRHATNEMQNTEEGVVKFFSFG